MRKSAEDVRESNELQVKAYHEALAEIDALAGEKWEVIYKRYQGTIEQMVN